MLQKICKKIIIKVKVTYQERAYSKYSKGTPRTAKATDLECVGQSKLIYMIQNFIKVTCLYMAIVEFQKNKNKVFIHIN